MHCDQCGAKGKITKHTCSVCKGSRVVDSESLDFLPSNFQALRSAFDRLDH